MNWINNQLNLNKWLKNLIAKKENVHLNYYCSIIDWIL